MAAERVVPLARPLDLALTVAPLRRGPGDPTAALSRNELWKAMRTPEGPACLHVHVAVAGCELRAQAWGPGAGWALDNAPRIAGCHDDGVIEPRHDPVRDLTRRFPGVRMTRSGMVMDALVPTVVEQKITGAEARRIWRRMVVAADEPAPGPAPLLLPPAPETLAALPYHAFHPWGLERRRASVIRRACVVAPRLEAAAAAGDGARVAALLRALPGIGPWTVAETVRVALGDPDAVSVGDYHLPHLVAWALAGEPRGSDERMLELLEPYRGQRGRVVRLLEVGGPRPPRRGPRMRARSIVSI